MGFVGIFLGGKNVHFEDVDRQFFILEIAAEARNIGRVDTANSIVIQVELPCPAVEQCFDDFVVLLLQCIV